MSGREAPEIMVEFDELIVDQLQIAVTKVETDSGFSDLVEKLSRSIKHVPNLKKFLTRSYRSKEDWDLAFMYAKYLRSVEEAFGEADEMSVMKFQNLEADANKEMSSNWDFYNRER